MPASKELRHEAADHLHDDTGNRRYWTMLQRSCGMKPQITIVCAWLPAPPVVLQRSCGMKPQITKEMPISATEIWEASKELRHEAADHYALLSHCPVELLASKELRHEAADHAGGGAASTMGSGLQRSCGMKPQITSDSLEERSSANQLQRSCGMKPQITGEF